MVDSASGASGASKGSANLLADGGYGQGPSRSGCANTRLFENFTSIQLLFVLRLIPLCGIQPSVLKAAVLTPALNQTRCQRIEHIKRPQRSQTSAGQCAVSNGSFSNDCPVVLNMKYDWWWHAGLSLRHVIQRNIIGKFWRGWRRDFSHLTSHQVVLVQRFHRNIVFAVAQNGSLPPQHGYNTIRKYSVIPTRNLQGVITKLDQVRGSIGSGPGKSHQASRFQS